MFQGQVEPRGRQKVEQEEESSFFGFRPWRHPQEKKGKIIMSRLRGNFSRLLVMVTSPIKNRIRGNKTFFPVSYLKAVFSATGLADNSRRKGQENNYFSCFKYRMPPFRLLDLSMWKRRKEDGNEFFLAVLPAASLGDRLQEKSGKALKGGHCSCRPWQHLKEEKRTKNLLYFKEKEEQAIFYLRCLSRQAPRSRFGLRVWC